MKSWLLSLEDEEMDDILEVLIGGKWTTIEHESFVIYDGGESGFGFLVDEGGSCARAIRGPLSTIRAVKLRSSIETDRCGREEEEALLELNDAPEAT